MLPENEMRQNEHEGPSRFFAFGKYALVAFCLFLWWVNIRDIDLEYAWRGFSPIDWVYQTVYPEDFVNNFPSGVENYKHSAFMQIYLLAYKFLSFQPESLLPILIGVEIGLLSWAVWCLSQTIFSQKNSISPIIVVILVIASHAGEMNLARFETTFFKGLFYNVADSLRIFAIVFALKKRLLVSSIFLGFSVSVHPIIGLIGTAFVCAASLVTPRPVKSNQAVLATLFFLLIGGTWIFYTQDFRTLSTDAIPYQMWFDLTRLNNFHWYPVDYGLFTFEHQERFIPFLSFFMLLSFSLYNKKPLSEIDRRILSAIFAMTSLICAGILISLWRPHPAIVKLCLHRANDLIIIIGLIYIVNEILNELNSARLFQFIIALLVLLSPFVMSPGFPFIISLLLIFSRIDFSGRLEKGSAARWFPFSIALGVIILMGVYASQGMLRPWWTNAYTGFQSWKYWLLIASFGIILYYAKVFQNLRAFFPHILMAGIILLGINWGFNQRISSQQRMLGNSFKETQIWAKRNTAQDSLFMVDPTIYYGWRDFSQRSSFGNLREWLHTSWLYNSKFSIYQEGLKRFNELSIDLKEYLISPSVKDFNNLSKRIEAAFYSKDDEWKKNMTNKFGIDYFVLRKDRIKQKSGLRIVYENTHFLILEAKGV